MKELVFPILLLAVLGSMLLPLPPAAIDFLLIGNLLIAVGLLMSSLAVTEALKLSALPTILLISTLFRLALNIATTRSILSSGEAGKVVEVFGEVVVGGNIIVGLVIFLIISLIQFIVIAKGAERVAEVAARFTLDALPGKQMSIDADVRAGLIDFETARKRRAETQTESRFYGALDGAMKFVKGDVIAGLCMIAVNIVGGLLVGVMMENLDFSRAASKYTLLTVGDGLVSQIPALFNALAAGIVVTRVSKGDGATLAHEFLSQIGQGPRVRLLIGGLALLMTTVPGMPILPLLSLGLVFILSSFAQRREQKDEEKLDDLKFEPMPPPLLQVELDLRSLTLLQGSREVIKKIQEFRAKIHSTTGLVILPPEFIDSRAQERKFRIRLRGVIVATGTCGDDKEQVLSTILSSLQEVITSKSQELIDDMHTRRILDLFDKGAPELVSAVVPGVVSVTQLTEVLRCLNREGIPVRNFDVILQAVAEHGQPVKGIRSLVEDVRISLRRAISSTFADHQGCLRAFSLEALADYAFVSAEKENKPLNLELVALIESFLKSRDASGMVMLVSRGARRLLQECLAVRGLKIPVLAYEEIVEEIKINMVETIDFPEGARKGEILARLAA